MVGHSSLLHPAPRLAQVDVLPSSLRRAGLDFGGECARLNPLLQDLCRGKCYVLASFAWALRRPDGGRES